MKPIYKPTDRIYKVNDLLYAGVYPGDLNLKAQNTKLEYLLTHGVRVFIDLTEPYERTLRGPLMPYDKKLNSLAKKHKVKVKHTRFAIPDMGVPSVEYTTRILDYIDSCIKAGKGVYVHCWGGHGRTGTIIGCWLTRHCAEDGFAALDMLDELRANDPTGCASPQTTMQNLHVLLWQMDE